MQISVDTSRVLNATKAKPVDQSNLHREVLINVFLRQLISNYPVEYAYTICKSPKEIEQLLNDLVSDECTDAETVLKGLNRQ